MSISFEMLRGAHEWSAPGILRAARVRPQTLMNDKYTVRVPNQLDEVSHYHRVGGDWVMGGEGRAAYDEA